jgi:hypothetical protein
MFRKVILHQTMSGGAKSQGTGVGKGGMDTEDAGPKKDCTDAGAQFVESVFNLQLVPSILNLNYGQDGDLEAPTVRLVDHEVGGLADAQRDQILANIIDVPDTYVRRKYGVPKPGPNDKLASQEVGVNGAQAIQQQQQYADQKKAQEDGMKLQTEQAKAMQQPAGGGAGGGAGQQQSRGTNDDGSGAVAAKAAELEASAASALEETIAPLIDRLKAIEAITDRDARIAAMKKFLKDEPSITNALKHDTTLAKAIATTIGTK